MIELREQISGERCPKPPEEPLVSTLAMAIAAMAVLCLIAAVLLIGALVIMR